MIYPRFLLNDLLSGKLDVDMRVTMESILIDAVSMYGIDTVRNAVLYIKGTRSPIHVREEQDILAVFGYIAGQMKTDDHDIVEHGLRMSPKHRVLRENLREVVQVYGRILF